MVGWTKLNSGPNKGKYYKTFHSKIRRTDDDYSMTGFCGDYSLLKPILDFVKTPNETTDLEDIINDCVEGWRIDWEKDMEFANSDENIIETIEANEYEFTENGSIH